MISTVVRLYRTPVRMAGINVCFLGSVFAFVSYGAFLTAEAIGQTRCAAIPITVYVCAAAAVPISMLMAARGRRVGFLVGAISGMLAALAIGSNRVASIS